MRKFEYKIITTRFDANQNPKGLQETLNQEGENGWELVTSNKDEYPSSLRKGDGEEIVLIFKKEIK